VLDLPHTKTESGRAEIRARALPLSRAARNLLHVIDASKPAGDWLRLVTGTTEADLTMLSQHGLIAPQVAAPAGTLTLMPDAALLDRAALYTYLSGAATKLLGPFKGYAFALEVERADSLAALQTLALQLVERVHKAKGDAAAAAVRQAIGLR
jgi:hypothetical protein